VVGESRWPPAGAIVVFMAFNIAVRVWLPADGVLHFPWLAPVIETVLLAVLLTTGSAGPAEHVRLRRVALVLVGVFVTAALWATALLIRDLVQGVGVSQSPDELLASGALVWLGNNIAFALLYWLIDGGGPAARLRRPAPVDFAFTQHLEPATRHSARGAPGGAPGDPA
jgi:hypothetical protein